MKERYEWNIKRTRPFHLQQNGVSIEWMRSFQHVKSSGSKNRKMETHEMWQSRICPDYPRCATFTQIVTWGS